MWASRHWLMSHSLVNLSFNLSAKTLPWLMNSDRTTTPTPTTDTHTHTHTHTHTQHMHGRAELKTFCWNTAGATWNCPLCSSSALLTLKISFMKENLLWICYEQLLLDHRFLKIQNTLLLLVSWHRGRLKWPLVAYLFPIGVPDNLCTMCLQR